MNKTDFNKILPNWTLKVEEVSNNVFHFLAINQSGNQIELTESDFESGLDKSINQAFDIEVEINTNPNKLYFDTFIKLLEGRNINKKKYEPEIFGSWSIRVNKTRIVLDGHESELRIESKKLFSRQKWVEKQSHDLRTRLKLSDIKMITNEIK
ncbi:hypothetical protein [Carboxylicivirga taeanensis]|uniref:hypothetical protein n=1 Tax=Carboxylicivirga taeanensis TaxID=1416875 RepID=UPI003F6E404D